MCMLVMTQAWILTDVAAGHGIFHVEKNTTSGGMEGNLSAVTN